MPDSRPPTAFLAVGLAGLLLAGCGSRQTGPSAQTDSRARQSATAAHRGVGVTPSAPTVAPTGSTYATGFPTPDPGASVAPFTGPAADRFGSDNVTTAYQFATDLAMTANFNENLAGKFVVTARDYSYLDEFLTPGAVTELHRLTAEAAKPGYHMSTKDSSALLSLAQNGMANPGLGITLRNPGVRDAGYGGATAEVYSRPGRPDALVLRFPVTGTYLISDHGTAEVIDMHKDVAYTLVQTGQADRPWLVDGWRATYTYDGPKADPQG